MGYPLTKANSATINPDMRKLVASILGKRNICLYCFCLLVLYAFVCVLLFFIAVCFVLISYAGYAYVFACLFVCLFGIDIIMSCLFCLLSLILLYFVRLLLLLLILCVDFVCFTRLFVEDGG